MTLGLLEGGIDVAAVDKEAALLDELALMARGKGRIGRLEPFRADLSDPVGCEQVVSAVMDAFGRIDILVNNAGLTFTYIDPDRYRRPEVQRF